ncbi:MAG: Asp-tRNA(Asn)/Glu-tRNA(Gln) amidotransferase subunit GatC [Kiritimatiellales bacterium]|nr:Asp-tRNA(Asn)/Glu-tRNA(Gln) amidotransferase subunit GatC [Kiritimatiellota bacterium]MBL7011458.1 Asp-tRNA(Asn)/Glu-tRNA(Gln) amidotransferase subunit GatC [Kiritimatiellales bacterium]
MSDANHMDVSYVANLARIELTDEETKLFQGQLDQVLDYVEQLGELDVSNVEPTAHAVPMVNVLRADEPGVSLDNDTVTANAPASRDGQILVPKINEQF